MSQSLVLEVGDQSARAWLLPDTHCTQPSPRVGGGPTGGWSLFRAVPSGPHGLSLATRPGPS